MDFTLNTPINIIGGENCVTKRVDIFAGMGKHALVITGARSARASGALDDVTAALALAGVDYTLFDGMRENPLVSICARAGQTARQVGADHIIAIGGGSVLDGARAASVFAVTDFVDPADLFKMSITDSLPMVTVGTTAGTGSEVDDVAVLTDDATGHKLAIKADCLFARAAFCDYRYTKSMTLRQTVSTGLDALCHCLESWFNTTAAETTVTFARRGVELLFPRLAQLADGIGDLADDDLRRDLYYGSLWGGLAITQAGTGFPHPAGYPLTEQGGVPHGVACALFEPAFLRTVWPHIDYLAQGQLLAITGTFEQCIEVLEKLTVNDLTASDAACVAMGERAQQSPNIAKTPGSYTGDQCADEARRQFLKEDQQQPVAGGWLLAEH